MYVASELTKDFYYNGIAIFSGDETFYEICSTETKTFSGGSHKSVVGELSVGNGNFIASKVLNKV